MQGTIEQSLYNATRGHVMDGSQKHPKYGVPVRVIMNNEKNLLGVVYVRQNQRIIDLLCDDRAFFPLGTVTGTILVSKASVMQVDVQQLETVVANADLFPEINLHYLRNNTW